MSGTIPSAVFLRGFYAKPFILYKILTAERLTFPVSACSLASMVRFIGNGEQVPDSVRRASARRGANYAFAQTAMVQENRSCSSS
ncbi:hypothetical protein HSX11_26035 [Oxalobacteraceae bacterium]|nr:hypothetical protein [Oxalobacteraceae bacterium]